MVGQLFEVLYTTPRSVTAAPPSDVTLPPKVRLAESANSWQQLIIGDGQHHQLASLKHLTRGQHVNTGQQSLDSIEVFLTHGRDANQKVTRAGQSLGNRNTNRSAANDTDGQTPGCRGHAALASVSVGVDSGGTRQARSIRSPAMVIANEPAMPKELRQTPPSET